MKKKPLTLLIAGLLGSTAVWAQPELTLVQIGEKTVERLESIKAMAERGEGVFERNGERWINYQGFEYRLSYKNDVQFPFLPYQGGDDTPYRNVIDFVDQSWEFMMYNGGFYLMSREFGVYESDEQGCFVNTFQRHMVRSDLMAAIFGKVMSFTAQKPTIVVHW